MTESLFVFENATFIFNIVFDKTFVKFPFNKITLLFNGRCMYSICK